MSNEEFLEQLKEKFYNKGTWFKPSYAIQDAVLDTIKSLLQKKNLIIITKAELTELKNKVSKINPENY